MGQTWVKYKDVEAQEASDGVQRRVLAYTDTLMCVENTFEEGAIGALHTHPHTQITYVITGEFEFEIEGEKRIVTAGDSMVKEGFQVHGCVCKKKGVLLDIFHPKRDDFL